MAAPDPTTRAFTAIRLRRVQEAVSRIPGARWWFDVGHLDDAVKRRALMLLMVSTNAGVLSAGFIPLSLLFEEPQRSLFISGAIFAVAMYALGALLARAGRINLATTQMAVSLLVNTLVLSLGSGYYEPLWLMVFAPFLAVFTLNARYVLLQGALAVLTVVTYLQFAEMTNTLIVLKIGFMAVVELCLVVFLVFTTVAMRSYLDQLHETGLDLDRARHDAERANLAKSQFLANVSHEIRTPLTSILGYTELIQEDARDAEIHDFDEDLVRVRTAGEQLLSLINDILDLSKIESGHTLLEPEVFVLGELFDELARTTEPLLGRGENRLTVELSEPSLTLHTDRGRLRQVLLNLLSNAAKFTNEGAITLRASREGDDLVGIEVEDDGIGMNEEQQERIFEAFVQADASTTREYGGTGLGLALCRSLCEILGGSISLTSAPGIGSTFRVSIPRVLPSQEMAVAAE